SSTVIQSLAVGGVLAFRDSTGTETMRISGGGAIGIGTTTPISDLHVYDANGNADIIAERGGGARVTMMSQAAAGWIGTLTNHNLLLGTNGSARMTITPGGLVGIGTTTPGASLTITSSDPRIRLQDTNTGGE